MKIIASIMAMCCGGCVSYVRELHSGQYPLADEATESVLGIDASYAQYGLKLGLIRHHHLYLPAFTNHIYLPTFDSSFRLGQSWTDTSVTESTVTGYEGNPPPARFQRLFHPKETPAQEKLESPKAKDQSMLPNASAHSV